REPWRPEVVVRRQSYGQSSPRSELSLRRLYAMWAFRQTCTEMIRLWSHGVWCRSRTQKEGAHERQTLCIVRPPSGRKLHSAVSEVAHARNHHLGVLIHIVRNGNSLGLDH